jgi:hypothetical protein
MLERFGLTNSLKWISFCFLDEGIDTTQNFFIGFLPKQIIIPCMIGGKEFQSMRGLSVPLPFSNWDMDSIKRLIFFGERKRYAVSSRAL